MTRLNSKKTVSDANDAALFSRMKKIQIYDTTLRDGTQGEGITLSLADMLRIATRLDKLGVDFIEGGWPASNDTDKAFFREIRNHGLSHARISAFGSTCSPHGTAESDPQLQALIDSKPDAICIFGKTWDLHVHEALRTTEEHNLSMIRDSLAVLRPHVEVLHFDAEHFFDGFKSNPEYALDCLRAAHEGGAEVLVLCDTNGGTLPSEIRNIIQRVRTAIPEATLGIHTHNDSDTAVAGAIEAVLAGAQLVQGTINGYGERCGNANLCSIIPNLELKHNGAYTCLPEGHMNQLAEVSRFVSDICNLHPFDRQPYVGTSAFAHKGGVHISAVRRNPRTYEHIEPRAVGNAQRILLSRLSGRSSILHMAEKYNYPLDKNDKAVKTLLDEIKAREDKGYEYASAEASFELLFFRALGWTKEYFERITFSVSDSVRGRDSSPYAEATVMIRVGDRIEHTAATGKGQVNALDVALRKALTPCYPSLAEMRLEDYKVRVLPGIKDDDTDGTASVVRVLIESADNTERWTTVGVHYDLVLASWQALIDSVVYKLFKDDPDKVLPLRTAE